MDNKPNFSPFGRSPIGGQNRNQGGNAGRREGGQGGPGSSRFGGGGRLGGFRGRGRGQNPGADKKSEYDQKVLDIARVTRVTKGGKRFSFRATVVIGDSKGTVGVGVAKGRDVSQAIQKAVHQAKKTMIKLHIKNATILHPVMAKYNSAVVILKPAAVGNGVKAGGAIRAVAKLGGIENITAKLISRTNNKINIARATIEALSKLKIEKTVTTPTIP